MFLKVMVKLCDLLPLVVSISKAQGSLKEGVSFCFRSFLSSYAQI